MGKQRVLSLAVMAALTGVAASATAEWDVSGVLKNETAAFTNSGPSIGQAQSTTDRTGHDGGELLKFENSLNLFINGQLIPNFDLHAQVNLIFDTEAVDGYAGHKDYSQNDYLRELYVDTKAGVADLRIGKQQVVWGTADGIKLLDIINPTDWREFVQNTMEDSRIPVWMAKAEVPVGQGDVQFLVTQHQENLIPGLNAEGDSGQAFIMKGVDTITGDVNGFYNIVPQLGLVANTFWGGFGGGANLAGATNVTVGDFASGTIPASSLPPGIDTNGNGVSDADDLNFFTQLTNNNKTSLIDGGSANWDSSNPDSVFEYMSNTTFATFDTFVNAKSDYDRDYPDELEPNLGMRYRGTLGSGFNYSLNYLYHYDANPYVDMHWENQGGTELDPYTTTDATTGYKTVHLSNPDTGADECSAANGDSPCTLVMTEKLNRVHSLGTSFDTSVDFKAVGPVVFRGELLYQLGAKSPVIDRELLSYGDLVGAMQMEDSDQFKYVLGADFTFFTNLMVSAQFIQFINLDYVDDKGGLRYTADPTVLHLSNGLLQAEEFKEFYSLFFSKPFGEEQQGRWNNITLFEENGGYWNRFDVEYSFSDAVVGLVEWNQFWGDENTMFGQFEDASNVQVGVKYLF